MNKRSSNLYEPCINRALGSEIVKIMSLYYALQVHQFERELDRLRARQKTEMEQKLKQMMADERRLLKHIKDKHDSDMKAFVSDQKAAYKAAKNQFKKVCALS